MYKRYDHINVAVEKASADVAAALARALDLDRSFSLISGDEDLSSRKLSNNDSKAVYNSGKGASSNLATMCPAMNLITTPLERITCLLCYQFT